MNVAHVSVWSATKVAFLVGLIFGAVTFIMFISAWSILSASGFLGQISTTLQADFSTTGGSTVTSLLGFGAAAGFGAVAGILVVVFVTILGTVAAALYNIAIRLTGGAAIGFRRDAR